MNLKPNRRDFLKSAGAGTIAAASFPAQGLGQASADIPPRIGFVGVGDRGSYHLDVALGIDGLVVPALCDIKDSYLYRAKRWVEEAWEVVETWEQTGKWATLALEGMGNLALLNLVQKGLLGEIVHAEGGYIHDLRLVKFDPEREPWRLQHSVMRNGNLYPDPPMSNMIFHLDINRGDRFDYLVSMSSASRTLNEYAALNYGKDHPYASQAMAQGDYNASLIRTVKGKMVTLNFDTNTPHPRGLYRIQGTKGVFMRGRGIGGSKFYLDGRSPESHRWKSAEPYLSEYEHPVTKNYNPPRRRAIRGHGGAETRTPIHWDRLVRALRENRMPDWDVYDSVTSSAVSPLSEVSVANRSQPVDFPDFTRGKWETREPIQLI